MRCAILDDYQNVALGLADWSAIAADVEIQVFNEHLGDEAAVAKALAEFEVVAIMRERTPFPRSLFEKLPKLKLLVTTGMGNLSVDLAAAKEHGVVVSGTDILKYPTAELTWGLVLAATRRIPQECRSVAGGAWQTTLGTGLDGKTLGVIGLGTQGARVASYGKAFAMQVLAWSQNLTAERCAEVGVTLASKEELLARADVVTIHMVLGERSRGLIGAEDLAQMKPSATLINTSRGPIVDEAALIKALTDGTIAGAGLDVFDQEPLAEDHPLRRLPNAVVTPHIGYVTAETYRIFYQHTLEDIRAWLDGAPVRVLTAAK
ncbi:MAG: D-2-hydroxyacid dehydrogenase family protein [Rhodospirillales bacterium]|nr:D-2-hydroxyacid dehydrogenase family protein [Rhodospirillales bacterium]